MGGLCVRACVRRLLLFIFVRSVFAAPRLRDSKLSGATRWRVEGEERGGGAQTRTMTPPSPSTSTSTSPPFISFIQAVNEPSSRLPRAQVCLSLRTRLHVLRGGFVIAGHVLRGHAADETAALLIL